MDIINATATATASVTTTQHEDHIHYEDGDEIQVTWHAGFFLLAYFTAFIGTYAAIRILEHGLWRSEKERLHATIFSRYPRFSMAFTLGSCAVWSMHFIGMQAEELILPMQDHPIMCYDWFITLMSLVLAIGGVWAGVVVAGWDVFAGPNRFEMLKEIVHNDVLGRTADGKGATNSRHVYMVAFFDMLHWIVAGSLLAALGALSMHYVGMLAMRGPFRRVWSFEWVAASAFLGAVVCFVGFWILFRPLHWKVEKVWYRPASAAVIALAVCSLHFLGMKSVTYIFDADMDMVAECSSTFGRTTFQGWRTDQFQTLVVAMFVPFVAFCIEHTISHELRETYRHLVDVQMSGSEFILDGDANMPARPKKSEKSIHDTKDSEHSKSTQEDTHTTKVSKNGDLWSGEVPGTSQVLLQDISGDHDDCGVSAMAMSDLPEEDESAEEEPKSSSLLSELSSRFKSSLASEVKSHKDVEEGL